MTNTHSLILHDLIARTEKAVETVAHLAVDIGVTFQIADVVDTVERGLPANYPAPTVGPSRRDLITNLAQDIISGDLYE